MMCPVPFNFFADVRHFQCGSGSIRFGFFPMNTMLSVLFSQKQYLYSLLVAADQRRRLRQARSVQGRRIAPRGCVAAAT